MILAIEYGEPTRMDSKTDVGSSRGPDTGLTVTLRPGRCKVYIVYAGLGRDVLAIRFARLGLHFSRSPLMVTSSPLPRVAVAGLSSTLPIVEATTAMMKGHKGGERCDEYEVGRVDVNKGNAL
jgi:hypothetical protein